MNASAISVCLDESCDINDVAQLVIWARIVDSNLDFDDEILDLQPLTSTTKSVDIYEALVKTLQIYKMNIQEVTSITTDGAAAMTGTKSGLIALIKKTTQVSWASTALFTKKAY